MHFKSREILHFGVASKDLLFWANAVKCRNIHDHSKKRKVCLFACFNFNPSTCERLVYSFEVTWLLIWIFQWQEREREWAKLLQGPSRFTIGSVMHKRNFCICFHKQVFSQGGGGKNKDFWHLAKKDLYHLNQLKVEGDRGLWILLLENYCVSSNHILRDLD